ncbi:MAG: hypothetical protein WCP21_21320 [Armatimonadota bacterium]
MFRHLTPSDPMKLPRALLAAGLGVLFVLWRLVSTGFFGAASASNGRHEDVIVSQAHVDWTIFVEAIVAGVVVGFLIGWLTPHRRRRIWTD